MTSQSIYPAPFEVHANGASLTVVIGSALRDSCWAAHFGGVQQAIEKKTWRSRAFSELVYDFRACTWADPLPLLYILLSAAEFSDSHGAVSIALPEPGEGSDRFLKYLSKEGFLHLLAKVANGRLNSRKQIITAEDILAYGQVGAGLAYVDSTLLPAQLLGLTSHEAVRAWVEQQIEMLGSTLVGKGVPGWAIEDVLYRLKVVLLETLYNVVDHAYANRDTGYAAVYARYRKGLVGVSAEERAALRLALSAESDKSICPRLPKDFLEGREGCLEIFVADAGVGLSESVSSFLVTRTGAKPRYPFREACRLVFSEGVRRQSSGNSLTRYGGLHLLNRLLGTNGDFVRGRDDDDWVGTALPLHRVSAGIAQGALAREHCGTSVRGLSWTCRLSWPSPTDREEMGSWKKWKGESCKHPYAEELKTHHVDPREFSGVQIVDRRFMLPGKSTLPSAWPAKQSCLLLPNPGLSKNDILKMVIEISENWAPGAGIHLVVGDIPSHEATTYSAALDGFQADKRVRWPGVFSKISLVSQQFGVCVLTYSDSANGFEHSAELSTIFLSNAAIGDSEPCANLRRYVQLLRYQDSMVFWRHLLSRHKDDDTYVSGEVKWGANHVIRGYLDFGQTLTDDFYRRFYRWLLQRLPCLSPFGRIRLTPVDAFVRVLALHFNSTIMPRFQTAERKDEAEVHIGSVQVTGFTQSLLEETGMQPPPLVTHFFRHPDAIVEAAHLLLWLQPESLSGRIPSKEQYCRVGTTSAIAPLSWDRYQLPRYDESGHPVYGRCPSDTYRDWQDPNPCIMKVGHWQYESNHDVLTVNISSALRYSFSIWGDLACFLMRNFFRALGIASGKDTRLTQEGMTWFERTRGHRRSRLPQVGVILYASHSNTDMVIEFLRTSLVGEIQKRIVPLGPLRISRTGSAFLVSPLKIHKIGTLLKSATSKNVLLFDDALISGRTNAELRHLLLTIGAEQVYTMAVLERRRLPHKVVDANTTVAYWRLDVPVVGNEATCPICHALAKVTEFSKELTSQTSLARISEWQQEWALVLSLTDWGHRGLSPVAISLTSGTKKYGISRPDSVHLTRSTGLTTYVSELHTMAFRDDYVLAVLGKEPDLNLPAKLELVTTQLLMFGNEFTMDVRERLLRELFTTVNKYPETDRHTSLAALVFFLQEGTVLKRLVNDLSLSGELNRIVRNADLAVALAYAAHVLGLRDSRQALDSDGLRGAVHQLRYGDDIAAIYDCLHLETYSGFGSAHARPLEKFVGGQLLDPVAQLTEVLNSIDHLRDAVDKIKRKPDLPRPPGDGETSVELLNRIAGSFSTVYEAVRTCLKTPLDPRQVADAQNEVGALLNSFAELHDTLFYRLSIRDINSARGRPFERDELATLLNTYSADLNAIRQKNGKGAFEGNVLLVSPSGDPFPADKRSEVWVIWDAYVRELVKDLAANVTHAESPIPDHWGYVQDLAYLWMQVEYKLDHLEIVMANSSSRNADFVSRHCKKKYSFLHLEDLGGKVTWEDCSHDGIAILLTRIRLPYAGKARSLSRQ